MSLSRAQTGVRRGGLQSMLCAVGHHAYESVGKRTEIAHRYSDVHEALYEVVHHRELMRCAQCGHESVRLANVEQVEVGHYERVFVKKG